MISTKNNYFCHDQAGNTIILHDFSELSRKIEINLKFSNSTFVENIKRNKKTDSKCVVSDVTFINRENPSEMFVMELDLFKVYFSNQKLTWIDFFLDNIIWNRVPDIYSESRVPKITPEDKRIYFSYSEPDAIKELQKSELLPNSLQNAISEYDKEYKEHAKKIKVRELVHTVVDEGDELFPTIENQFENPLSVLDWYRNYEYNRRDFSQKMNDVSLRQVFLQQQINEFNDKMNIHVFSQIQMVLKDLEPEKIFFFEKKLNLTPELVGTVVMALQKVLQTDISDIAKIESIIETNKDLQKKLLHEVKVMRDSLSYRKNGVDDDPTYAEMQYAQSFSTEQTLTLLYSSTIASETLFKDMLNRLTIIKDNLVVNLVVLLQNSTEVNKDIKFVINEIKKIAKK